MATATKKAAAPAAKKAAPAGKASPVGKAAASAKKAGPAKKPAAKAANGVAKKVATGSPVKEKFTKASLAQYVASAAQVEPKTAKAVLAALESTILGAVHKKGAGEFTLSGLLKITVQQVPKKEKRFGKDPFTGQERWFPAKPATVRLKARALKKLKDAAAA